MQHIQALQAEGARGARDTRAAETMLAEHALLREQAEEAKFYMAEAEAKAKEYEDMSSKPWPRWTARASALRRPRASPTRASGAVFVSGLSISQGGGALDPDRGDPAQAHGGGRRPRRRS